jgi:cytidylate kinase
VIVTVSREYGAGGLAVAQGVAATLGLELMTDRIPDDVAARLGTSSEDVDARAESAAPLGDRIVTGFGVATAEVIDPRQPHLPGEFDEEVRREIERTIRERAARGDVVILGRVGSAILAGTPQLLRAFVYAEREWRIRYIMEVFGFQRARALAEVDRIDVERRRFAAERYGIVWGDRRYYDIIVDSSRLSIEGAVAAIVAAARCLVRT